MNEIFKYEVPGVCDARIWYELIITKEKMKNLIVMILVIMNFITILNEFYT